MSYYGYRPRYSKKFITNEMEHYSNGFENIKKWALNNALRQYVIFNLEEDMAYCTKCETRFARKEKYKHLTFGRCPECNAKVQFINKRIRKCGTHTVDWIGAFENYGDDLHLRLFGVVDDISDVGERKVTMYEKERETYTRLKTYRFDYVFTYDGLRNRWKTWTEYNGINYKTEKTSAFCTTCTIYPYSYKNIKKVDWLKYSGLKEYLLYSSPIRTDRIDRYVESYRLCPNIEKMVKTLPELAFYPTQEDYSHNKLTEMLGISKENYIMLLKNKSMRDSWYVDYMQEFNNRKKDFYKAIYNYNRMYQESLNVYNYHSNSNIYKSLSEYAPLMKIIKYLSKNKIRLDDYNDYIDSLNELETEMTDFVLFPKHFKEAHDNAYTEVQANRDKLEQARKEAFSTVLDNLSGDIESLSLKKYGLFIRLPKAIDELTLEGQHLHHCVGTYKEKVMNHKTMIFFIRQESDPDKSYYTLEWNGHVVQCRGTHNCDMTDNVKKFVREFDKKMLEEANKLQLAA